MISYWKQTRQKREVLTVLIVTQREVPESRVSRPVFSSLGVGLGRKQTVYKEVLSSLSSIKRGVENHQVTSLITVFILGFRFSNK